MTILLVFAFISGLLTILAPCIWPLLPIILSATTTGGKRRPLGITVGIMVSFAFFTLTLSYVVRIIPFDPTILRLFAVIVIGFFGLTLIVPALNEFVEGLVSRLSGKVAGKIKSEDTGFRGGFITGAALGIVWSPCAGPILATIATLAATAELNVGIILVTVAYVTGVGIPLFLFATAGSHLFTKSRVLSNYTGRIQQAFGVVMIITALLILTNYDKVLQAKLLDAFPSYSSFIFELENNPAVKRQLDVLRNNEDNTQKLEGQPMDVTDMGGRLPVLATAPEFVGIAKWLNLSEGKTSLSMEELRGKVVLIDFWTYTCINCIRTLPHVTGWYEKYKDKGFVVVGVHTPEFEFEKSTENVLQAMKQYDITYPVAQDNDYATWRAYDNHYWPAKYLIDAQGRIRYYHFGEGQYEETEEAIRTLLEEAGVTVAQSMTAGEDATPRFRVSPETYLGISRAERFGSDQGLKAGDGRYTLSGNLPTSYFGFEGDWEVAPEYSASSAGSSLTYHFFASKVFLVIHPEGENDTVRVLLDGKPVTEFAGKDVTEGTVTVTEPRLYELVDVGDTPSDHTLELLFDSPGTKVFAFTFG